MDSNWETEHVYENILYMYFFDISECVCVCVRAYVMRIAVILLTHSKITNSSFVFFWYNVKKSLFLMCVPYKLKYANLY